MQIPQMRKSLMAIEISARRNRLLAIWGNIIAKKAWNLSIYKVISHTVKYLMTRNFTILDPIT